MKLHSLDDVNPADRRQILVSSMLGTTVGVFFAVAIPTWIGSDLGWALGLGGMSAVWGGPGFGSMMAGARLSYRSEHMHAPARPPVQTQIDHRSTAGAVALA